MAFKDTIAEIQRIDQEDFKRIGTAPVALRGLLILAGCAAVLGLCYWYLIKPEFAQLVVVEQKEVSLRAKFDSEQSKAANRVCRTAG